VSPITSRHRRQGIPEWLGRLLAGVLRLLAATWSVTPREGVGLRNETGNPLLVGFWHGKYFPLLPLLGGAGGAVLIGEGVRGRMIGAICRSFGSTPVFLPHGDRARAIARIRDALRDFPLCATPLDGPRGPARRPKPALIQVASEVGASILPVSVQVTPNWVWRWRWDQREIPLPFASVVLVTGTPIACPLDASGATLEAWGHQVASALDELGCRPPPSLQPPASDAH